MGRRRATRRSTIQKLRRVDAIKPKAFEEYKDALASRGDLDKMLRIYHERHIEPLVEFLNWHMAPWYKRLWWAMQDRWDGWRQAEPDKVSEQAPT